MSAVPSGEDPLLSKGQDPGRSYCPAHCLQVWTCGGGPVAGGRGGLFPGREGWQWRHTSSSLCSQRLAVSVSVMYIYCAMFTYTTWLLGSSSSLLNACNISTSMTLFCVFHCPMSFTFSLRQSYFQLGSATGVFPPLFHTQTSWPAWSTSPPITTTSPMNSRCMEQLQCTLQPRKDGEHKVAPLLDAQHRSTFVYNWLV